MMCCCHDVDELDGPPRDRAARGIEEHPPPHVIRLASVEADLISPVEVDQQMTNRRSKQDDVMLMAAQRYYVQRCIKIIISISSKKWT